MIVILKQCSKLSAISHQWFLERSIRTQKSKRGSREVIIIGLGISKRPRSPAKCLRVLFMSEDCFRLTKSKRGFYRAYILANKIGRTSRLHIETRYNECYRENKIYKRRVVVLQYATTTKIMRFPIYSFNRLHNSLRPKFITLARM